MKRQLCLLLAASVAAALAGCGQTQPSPPANRSVVVDLDAVARALGRDVVIANKVEQATKNLNAQLIQAAQDMQKQLEEEQAKLGDSPTEEQVTRFNRMRLQANQNVQNNKMLAAQAQARVRDEQVLLFRQEARPHAEKIAKQHGASLVVLANQNVLWFDSGVDITGQVIDAMREAGAAAPPPASGDAAPESGGDDQSKEPAKSAE